MSIPILMYHSVDSSGSVISVSPRDFEWQMQWLRDAGYNALSFSNTCKLLKGGGLIPARTICITFDDGYQNVYRSAFPILKQCGFTATVFLVSGYVGKDNQWPGQGDVPLMPLSPWEEILEMHHAGIEMGAHTVSHPYLDRLSVNDVMMEAEVSRRVISEKIGLPVMSFAYPYGAYGKMAKSVVSDLFSYACTTQLDFADERSDPLEVPRLDTFYFGNRKVFALIGTPTFSHYISLRRLFRRLRQSTRVFL